MNAVEGLFDSPPSFLGSVFEENIDDQDDQDKEKSVKKEALKRSERLRAPRDFCNSMK